MPAHSGGYFRGRGGTVLISPHTWTVYRSGYDRVTKTLDREKVGGLHAGPAEARLGCHDPQKSGEDL